MKKRYITSKAIYIFVMVVTTGLALSLALNNSIWLDEALSLRWTNTGKLAYTMGIIKGDVHPPLHYIMLYFWQMLDGHSIQGARILVMLALPVYEIAAWKFYEELDGVMPFVAFSAFMISLPYFLVKIVEIRMYSWSYTFMVLTAIFMYRVLGIKKTRDWVLFTIFALCSMYNHYYGLLSMVVVYITMFAYFLIKWDKKQIRNFIICSVVTSICYLPWLPTAIKQVTAVNNGYWISQGSFMDYIKELTQVWQFPHSPKVYCGILLVCAVIQLIHFIKHKDALAYWALACYVPFAVVLVFGYLYGLYIRPIMISRYLAIPFIMLVFGACSALRYIPKWISGIFVAFFVAMLVFTYKDAYEDEYDNYTVKTLNFFDEHIHEPDVIYSDNGTMKSVVWVYYPDVEVRTFTTDGISEAQGSNRIWFMDEAGYIGEFMGSLNLDAFDCNVYPDMGLDNVDLTIYEFVRK